jgi:hypothetical protein
MSVGYGQVMGRSVSTCVNSVIGIAINVDYLIVVSVSVVSFL